MISRCTATCLNRFADIYDKLIQNLDEGLNSCAIFLDLAKAFDSVSHTILLQKLHRYGIRGKALDLFTSYLTSRSQFVKLPNGVKSSLTEVEFGVPQGSIDLLDLSLTSLSNLIG